MTALRSTWVVFSFESRRALRLGPMLFAAALALFPAAVLALIQSQGARLDQRGEFWAVPVFVLVPEVVCLLGLLLWATPAIQAEVEGRTWTYLVVRPGGKVPVMLGKYAAAVVRAVLTGLVALAAALAVLHPPQGLARAFAYFSALVVLSCLTYASLYLLLGVIFVRRAMTVAVAYVFLIEFLLGLTPAVVNHLTVQYYLRSLLVAWFTLTDGPVRVRGMIGTAPPWQYVLLLLGMTAALLTAAALILRRRELVSSAAA
jgi:ABC-type transport system involved in multi-copper enzyme maturation permease subunit